MRIRANRHHAGLDQVLLHHELVQTRSRFVERSDALLAGEQASLDLSFSAGDIRSRSDMVDKTAQRSGTALERRELSCNVWITSGASESTASPPTSTTANSRRGPSARGV